MKKKRRESSHQHSRVNTVDYLLERHLIGDTNDRSYDLRPPSQRQAKGTPPPWSSFWGKKMNETLSRWSIQGGASYRSDISGMDSRSVMHSVILEA
ncbi:hypothetical protein NC651_025510 [Populus alba x Populus x berolinensis]|nr:hypothetical protein NC651_025510 [Populus alba x Populus x berolinensis]